MRGRWGARPPAAKETVPSPGRRLRVVTYNVHKCRGLDGRVRPERIAAVLQELNADIVPKANYEKQLLADGDKIEIVHFVGGG